MGDASNNKNGKTILAIDDDDRNMRLYRGIMMATDYRLIEAADEETALTLALDERPDLILMDIRLGGADGLTLSRTMKKEPSLKNVPIIAVSGLCIEDIESKLEGSGCIDFILKPFEIQDFLSTLNMYLQ